VGPVFDHSIGWIRHSISRREPTELTPVKPAMTISFRSLFVVLATAWVLALTSAVTATQGAAQPAASAAPKTAAPGNSAPTGRFDLAVRADFFAGFSGDMVRFERAITLCETVLAANPDHAEALVWHGAGLAFRAGLAFQSGDAQKGMELWGRGMAEMGRAVSLQPDNVAVRIPRGASLLEASRQMPPAQATPILKLAVEDYERVLALQSPYFDKLSDHARGELLFGLADGWARLGDKEKACEYFTRLTSSASSSGRVTYAKAWLDGAPPATVGRCVGCH
jgi:tetratricopeptide (TPR) repeat protein